MKVMIFNTLYYPNFVGGAELSVQTLAEDLRQMGLEVVVVSLQKNQYPSKLINGVKVYYQAINNLHFPWNNNQKSIIQRGVWHGIDTYNPTYQKSIKLLIETEKPDIIHTNNLAGFSTYIWTLAKSANLPIVHTIRDYYLMCPSASMFANGQNCTKQCLSCSVFSKPKKMLSSKVDAVVGVSNFILNQHLEHGYFVSSKYQKVIYNKIAIKPNQIQAERNQLVTFGFLGQVIPEKGVELLLQAAEQVREDFLFKLTIAGKGDSQYYSYLKEKYASEHNSFMGKVDSDEFYQQIDVLVVPSLWNEPFGRVVVEGLLNQKLVLGSKRGGISELLPDNQLFEPELEQLSEIMRAALRGKVKYQEQLQLAENNSNSSNAYLQIYNSLLENGN